MPTPEMSARKIVHRLKAEGWVNQGGGEHDVFKASGPAGSSGGAPASHPCPPAWPGASPGRRVGSPAACANRPRRV